MKELTDLTDFSDVPETLARRRVLRTQRAAAFLGISVPTLQRKRKRGELPRPVQLGPRSLGWTLGALIDYLDSEATKAA
jgi:predicted DNA-binding transcriptional regulator AlpA